MSFSSLRWAGLLGLLWSLHAPADPIVALDLDVDMSGIQSSRSIAAGQSFALDVLLDTDGSEVWGFSFDLFPGGIAGLPITATGISVSPVFGAGVDIFGDPNTDISEQTLDNGSGEAAATAVAGLFGNPADGAGIRLARLTYATVTAGLIDLLLNNVSLSDEFGVGYPFSTRNGAVEVAAAPVVPAPPGLALIAAGLGLLAGVRAGVRGGVRAGRGPAG